MNDDWLEPAAIEEVATEQEPGEPAEPEGETAASAPPAEPEKPAEDLAAKIKGLEAAAAAERHKRQMLEAQLAEKQQEEKPFLGEEYEQRFTETEQRFKQQLVAQKLEISEAFAREKYADFDEKFDVFKALLAENPVLYSQMVQQANPAEFVYRTAANQQKLREMGDPLKYEEQLKAKITAELEVKYAAKLEEETKKRASLPGSLATTAGAGGAAAAGWSGPTSLEDLLK